MWHKMVQKFAWLWSTTDSSSTSEQHLSQWLLNQDILTYSCRLWFQVVMFYFVFFDTFYNKETQQQRQTLTTQLVRKHKDTQQHNENSTIRTKRDLVQSEWFFYPLDRVVFLVGTAHVTVITDPRHFDLFLPSLVPSCDVLFCFFWHFLS